MEKLEVLDRFDHKYNARRLKGNLNRSEILFLNNKKRYISNKEGKKIL